VKRRKTNFDINPLRISSIEKKKRKETKRGKKLGGNLPHNIIVQKYCNGTKIVIRAKKNRGKAKKICFFYLVIQIEQ